MFARYDENPAMTLQDIKEKNVTDGRTHGRTDNVKTVYPPQTKFAGGIMIIKTNQCLLCGEYIYISLSTFNIKLILHVVYVTHFTIWK